MIFNGHLCLLFGWALKAIFAWFLDGLKRPFSLDFWLVLKSNFYLILDGLKREVALYWESVLMFWLSLSIVEFQYHLLNRSLNQKMIHCICSLLKNDLKKGTRFLIKDSLTRRYTKAKLSACAQNWSTVLVHCRKSDLKKGWLLMRGSFTRRYRKAKLSEKKTQTGGL